MIQDRFTQVALAKQTTLGGPQASGDFLVGIKGGQVAMVDIDEGPIGQTWSSRINEGQDRGAMAPGASFDVVAMRQSIGLLLLAALGTDTPTGSSPTRSHVFTVGDVLPYLTVHGIKDGAFYKTGDCRLNEFEFTWEGTKAATVKCSFAGCTLAFPVSTPTVGISERPKDGVLKGCGGTFTVDDRDAIVKSGSIKISNNVNPVHGSASPLPSDVFQGAVEITVSLTIVPHDLGAFRKTVTGTTGGTSVTCKPVISTFVASFSDGTNTLQFESDQLAAITEFPDTSADGGPVELALEGTVVAGTNAFKATLVNDVTAY